ncbi:MAG: hypothetical protein KatS3mg063_0688 [Tepidiforma sp.]|jgi:hypothetical protein|uniref:hypothetical protein n=1 Tax=Tepidiforma sp. TaxID=2682230 RepID=UPI0021DD20A1|nr:hypothetical protein [Tepidiforma sp.]GIW14835.1 MAG: hypothetical protein KatS3mg063_0688 [Tepidiforma sp.]
MADAPAESAPALNRPPRKKRHPLSGAIYEELPGNRVRVTKGESWGIFDGFTTRHIEGPLTYADPHMIIWVGGKPVEGLGHRAERARGIEIVHD